VLHEDRAAVDIAIPATLVAGAVAIVALTKGRLGFVGDSSSRPAAEAHDARRR
jgi:hypothetical protein